MKIKGVMEVSTTLVKQKQDQISQLVEEMERLHAGSSLIKIEGGKGSTSLRNNLYKSISDCSSNAEVL